MTDEKKFVMEQEFEDAKKGFKAGVKKHWKKGVAITGGVILTIIGVKAGYKYVTSGKELTDLDILPKAKDALEKLPEEATEPVDYGRDCVMKFFVQETGEFLGEDLCTEHYAQQMIEMGKAFDDVQPVFKG